MAVLSRSSSAISVIGASENVNAAAISLQKWNSPTRVMTL
jgi:hypothetical protein